MTFMIIAYILDLIVHDFVMNLCSEWLLLPVLAQELDDIAFAFGWGQKKPPLLYFVASDDVAEKNTAIWPRLTLSSFLMDSSRYTSNTTSIRKLSAPVHGADMKMASESSAKVLLLPWTLWTRLIPSMMQVDGCSIASANDTFFPAARPVWTCLSFSACHHNYQATMAMVQVDGSALISCPPSCLLQWVPYGQTTCGLLSGQSPCWYI